MDTRITWKSRAASNVSWAPNPTVPFTKKLILDISTVHAALKTDRIKLIACGRYHTIVASESGNVYTFGCNSESQLGLGENANDSFYNSPQRLRSLEQQEWRALAAGSGHSCALSETGELYVWGVNDNYELGLPSVKEQRTPRRVDLSAKIVYVSCGLYHTAVITSKIFSKLRVYFSISE